MIVRALVIVAMTSGCDVAFRLDHVPDLAPADALDGNGAVEYGPWSQPALVAEVNAAGTDGDISVTGDGLEMYMVSTRLGAPHAMSAKRASVTDPFGSVNIEKELDSAQALAGEVTPDGLAYYFSAPGPGGDDDIFVMTRGARTDAFTLPARVAQLSSVANDRNPTISADGLLAIITQVVTSTDHDLVMYTRDSAGSAWRFERELSELDTSYVDTTPYLSADALTLYFASDRVTKDQLSDMYFATRSSRSDPFGPATSLDQLDTPANNSDPCLLADQQTLYYITAGDVYVTTRSPL